MARYKLVSKPVLIALFVGAVALPAMGMSRDVLSTFARCVDEVPSKVSPEHADARHCRLRSGKDGALELVAEDAEDFVMLDVKMTSCPANAGLSDWDHPKRARYVHLLALPRAPVTGIEDARRKRAPHLWEFAWKTAKDYVPEEDLVLAVNPRAQRTQDQLHVHATRFSDGGRDAFLAAKPVLVRSLAEVWSAAESRADLSSGRFGVAVARPSAAGGGFAVVVTTGSPEALFSRRCDR